MPIFRNKRENCYALVSYKVLYSHFCNSPDWKQIGQNPTFRDFYRARFIEKAASTYFIVRSPYDRIASCFKDKFRKQPLRISENNFEWQACHRLLFPFCGLADDADDSLIAQRFLELSYSDFIGILPDIYRRDPHYHPQAWSRKITIRNMRLFAWPECKEMHIQEAVKSKEVPSVDFTIRHNSTQHIEQEMVLSDAEKRLIQKLYKEDFYLAGNQA